MDWRHVDRGTVDRSVAHRGAAWVRERHRLVAGVELTPVVRAALVGDNASPLTNRGTAGLQFINTDFTLLLARAPVGVFFGIQALDHHSTAGISVGQASLYDKAGVLGSIAVTALANPGRLTR